MGTSSAVLRDVAVVRTAGVTVSPVLSSVERDITSGVVAGPVMPWPVGAVRVAGSGFAASAVLNDAAHRRLDVQRVGVGVRGGRGVSHRIHRIRSPNVPKRVSPTLISLYP